MGNRRSAPLRQTAGVGRSKTGHEHGRSVPLVAGTHSDRATCPPDEGPSYSSRHVRGARVRRTAVDVAIGAVGALMLAFAVSSWVTTSLTGEPGSMSTGLGLLFAWGVGLVSVALLGWAGVRI